MNLLLHVAFLWFFCAQSTTAVQEISWTVLSARAMFCSWCRPHEPPKCHHPARCQMLSSGRPPLRPGSLKALLAVKPPRFQTKEKGMESLFSYQLRGLPLQMGGQEPLEGPTTTPGSQRLSGPTRKMLAVGGNRICRPQGKHQRVSLLLKAQTIAKVPERELLGCLTIVLPPRPSGCF